MNFPVLDISKHDLFYYHTGAWVPLLPIWLGIRFWEAAKNRKSDFQKIIANLVLTIFFNCSISDYVSKYLKVFHKKKCWKVFMLTDHNCSYFPWIRILPWIYTSHSEMFIKRLVFRFYVIVGFLKTCSMPQNNAFVSLYEGNDW